MMPPKPPRKSYTKPSITSSYEVIQPTYEDPDATMPPVTDGSQSEVKVKPVPHPRSKLKPKADCNSSNNSTVDSIHKTSNTTNTEQVSQYSADCGTPRSVCPPPRPPPPSKKATSSQPKAEIATGSCYVNTVTALKSAAVSSESAPFPPSLPPKRPPPPAVFYDRPKSTMSPEPEMYIDEIQRSRCSSSSSMQHSTDSSALSNELVGLCGTYSSMVTDGTGRPVVPPRLPRSYSTCETLPLQTRPKVPSFSPPPPPSPEAPSESVYWEIESRPYLDILPEDNKEVIGQVGSSPFQSGRCTSNHQTTPDTEDINTMLRWLKRVCKSDGMAPSLYGLSLEEEIRTFNQRALNLKKALRLYNLLMMKRCERLRDLIAEFSSISRSLDKMQKKTKTMGIAGGTTGAVGGVTAVLGIALAPVTMGTSLIATAVGAGMVASAGGMGAHTAKANKKIVGRMAVEKLVYEYKDKIVDLGHCLDFILSEMNELRRHDIPRLQRAGAQTDALKMAHLSQFVIKNNMNNAGKAFAGMSSERLLQAFAKEMDLYFSEKDCEKLKKSRESKFSGRVRLLAENLQDELDQMNRMWEMFS